MPLGAPIGSNRGVRTRDMIRIIIEQAKVPVVVDAAWGPSHAAEAMEMGADAVLVNTALADAGDHAAMAKPSPWRSPPAAWPTGPAWARTATPPRPPRH